MAKENDSSSELTGALVYGILGIAGQLSVKQSKFLGNQILHLKYFPFLSKHFMTAAPFSRIIFLMTIKSINSRCKNL